jgi:hypothetical protein
MGDGNADIASAALQVRVTSKDDPREVAFADAPPDELAQAVPWRTFRWYLGQRHYSGSYWAATEQAHVIYESRLELARLLYADFDRDVVRIVAQPFLMTAVVDDTVRRHVPDFLLLTAAGPIVVDVKPARKLDRPEVAFTFAWTKSVVEARGWSYQVWSEPPRVELENVRFLAGYRRSWLVNQEAVRALEDALPDGATLGQAFAAVPQYDEAIVRASAFHLIWSGRWATDLHQPLHEGLVLRVAS